MLKGRSLARHYHRVVGPLSLRGELGELCDQRWHAKWPLSNLGDPDSEGRGWGHADNRLLPRGAVDLCSAGIDTGSSSADGGGGTTMVLCNYVGLHPDDTVGLENLMRSTENAMIVKALVIEGPGRTSASTGHAVLNCCCCCCCCRALTSQWQQHYSTTQWCLEAVVARV